MSLRHSPRRPEWTFDVARRTLHFVFSTHLTSQARNLLERCRNRGLRLTAAESCTGGLIASVLTAVPGSSETLDRGFITYSNDAKTEILGVPAELIAAHGAVSEPVARAMVEGLLSRTACDLAVAVTGIAGPGGGTPTKPVGLVHIVAARRNGKVLHEAALFGDIGRDAVREATVSRALTMLIELAD